MRGAELPTPDADRWPMGSSCKELESTQIHPKVEYLLLAVYVEYNKNLQKGAFSPTWRGCINFLLLL